MAGGGLLEAEAEVALDGEAHGAALQRMTGGFVEGIGDFDLVPTAAEEMDAAFLNMNRFLGGAGAEGDVEGRGDAAGVVGEEDLGAQRAEVEGEQDEGGGAPGGELEAVLLGRRTR